MGAYEDIRRVCGAVRKTAPLPACAHSDPAVLFTNTDMTANDAVLMT